MSSKVTFLANSLTAGGAEKVLSVMITELVKQQIEVELICLEKEQFYTLPKEVKIIYFSDLNNRDSSIKKFLYLPLFAWKLKQYIKRNRIDTVQSHIYRANFVNIVTKLLGSHHKTQVVEVISINFFKKEGFSKKLNFFLIKRLYPYADLIIFKAKRMKSEFLKTIDYRGEMKVINNPYDMNTIRQLAHEKVDEFIFDDTKRYIINIGRLEAQKNQKSLIESITLLDNNVELIILGDGSQGSALEQLIKKSGVEGRVHLLGNQKNPYNFIQKSDIFVLSSYEEGFPNVLVEAMVCGTPVISTDCISGPREILAPKTDIEYQLKENIELAENGILYPINSQKDLVLAINKLLENKALYEHYVQQALKKSKEFSLKTIMNQYKEVLCVE